MKFLRVLKIYHVRPFIVEKMRFGAVLRRCGIYSKLQSLLQKTCISYASETLAACVGTCLRTHALAPVRRLRPMYTGYLKGYIFHFNTP